MTVSLPQTPVLLLPLINYEFVFISFLELNTLPSRSGVEGIHSISGVIACVMDEIPDCQAEGLTPR